MEIVTGSTGLAHVTPIDDAVRNSNTGYYADRVVFNTFRAFEAVAVTANEVRVYGGYGMNQGRIFKIDRLNYDSCTIENGAQGVKRADLIVARYAMNGQTGYEDISLVVIKGQAGTEYVDPSYTTGNMNEGDMQDDFPLYRVKLNGIVIEAVERLFTPLPDGGRFGQLENRVTSHLNNTNNPHTIAWTEAENLTPISAGETLKVQFGKIAKAIKSLISHIGNLSNPHKVGGSQLTDTVPINKGGTGASTAAGALENLGIPTVTPIDKGGTGATTAAAAREKLGVIPTNHASSSTTYGLGNASNFGHVKLTDSYDVTSPSAASDGVGASQKAVKDAYDAVLAAMGSAGYGDMMKNVYDPDNKGLDNTAGGIANRKSPVSSGALYATKAALQASFQDGVDTIYNATKNAGVTPSSSTPTAIATAIGNLRKTPYTGTYTFPSNDKGGKKDLGVPHSIRYVNAENVYNKGNADGYSAGKTAGISEGTASAQSYTWQSNICSCYGDGIEIYYDLTCVKSFKFTYVSSTSDAPTIKCKDSGNANSFTPVANTTYTPIGATLRITLPSRGSKPKVASCNIVFTFQAKKLR